MTQNLDAARRYLMDIPYAAGFQDSIRLLEEAFAEYSTPLHQFERNDLLDFHGRELLARLFGRDFEHLGCRSGGGLEPSYEVPPGARRRVQKWLVVGVGDSPGRGDKDTSSTKSKIIVLRGDVLGLLENRGFVVPSQVSAAESLVLRESLMNRRQATLVATHLNRFRRNRRHGEPLTWSVVAGPDRGSSPRTWLNALGHPHALLRGWHGEVDLSGIGAIACGSLSVFRMGHGPRVHDDQVFDFAAPQVRLPPRFGICALPPGDNAALPANASFTFYRGTTCERAYAQAIGVELACGLRGTGEDNFDYGVNSEQALHWLANALWGHEEDGTPMQYYVKGCGPASVYASGLSKEEAVATLRHLKSIGYRSAKAKQIGIDGSLGGGGGYESAYSKWHDQPVQCSMTESVPMSTPLLIRANETFYLPPFGPAPDWERWERNMFEACWKKTSGESGLEFFDAFSGEADGPEDGT